MVCSVSVFRAGEAREKPGVMRSSATDVLRPPGHQAARSPERLLRAMAVHALCQHEL